MFVFTQIYELLFCYLTLFYHYLVKLITMLRDEVLEYELDIDHDIDMR
jgi:hypothetical protein